MALGLPLRHLASNVMLLVILFARIWRMSENVGEWRLDDLAASAARMASKDFRPRS
jgi:hypothetical protein